MIKEKIIKIEFITPMLGTVTKDPTVYKTYIESLKPERKHPNQLIFNLTFN